MGQLGQPWAWGSWGSPGASLGQLWDNPGAALGQGLEPLGSFWEAPGAWPAKPALPARQVKAIFKPRPNKPNASPEINN